ncbi:MAG: hypothetical protein GWM92_12485, partial [Gemmatimonadetes bacterium]|nr:hypothetical protein [Gemmatimonadota bacterium]NIT88195.1 hypothetical protein [Gemmatimonadota bacterium]NIU79710.1 hypothetical protein [Gammaproteobacteria bacterium]NIY12684.1 hypothetical protein [Gemmatimonadota bacterium]NIY40226.1 hypothetical protein [Gemmatimonadota bacterium]
TDIRYDHEPAWGVTNTLQSVAVDVRQDRLTLAHDRPLGPRWSAGASGEVASVEHRGAADAGRNLRLAASASVGRAVSS